MKKENRIAIIGAGQVGKTILEDRYSSIVIIDPHHPPHKNTITTQEAVIKVFLNNENEPEKSFCVTANHQITKPVPFEKGFLCGFKVVNKNIRVGYIIKLQHYNSGEKITLKTPVRKVEFLNQ